MESPCSVYEVADSFKRIAIKSMNGSLFNDLVALKLCPTPVLGSRDSKKVVVRETNKYNERNIPFLYIGLTVSDSSSSKTSRRKFEGNAVLRRFQLPHRF